MSIPKEPRQMMINLMYLVLTAMLALNITREVLNAFNTINNSIVKSNNTIGTSNDELYKSFDALLAKQETAERAKPFHEKAMVVKDLSSKLHSYLETWKDSVIARSGGYEKNDEGVQVIKSMEDIDASTKLFVEEKNGDKIKAELEKYMQSLLAQVDDPNAKQAIKAQIPMNLANFPETEENPSGDWAFGNFHNMPVVAAVSMLSKFQMDIRNAEGLVVKYLHNRVDDNVIKIDEYIAVAVPNATYALPGDEITATITLAAYNRLLNPTITSNRGGVIVKEGVGTLKFKATGAGVQTVSGNISMPVGGVNKSYPYKFDVMVGATGASMELEAMNVVYIGVPNPARVAAAGYDIANVSLNVPGATVTKKADGQFTIDVSKLKPSNTLPYTVVAKAKDGSSKEITKGNLRVKEVPDPVAKFARGRGGPVATNVAKAQKGPIAELENFLMDGIRFNIVSFTFVWVPKNQAASRVDVKGTIFTEEARKYMEMSRPGDSWYIDDIKAVPTFGGRSRDLGSISIKLM